MSARKDGGPAFPIPIAEIQGLAQSSHDFGSNMTGMSLRDYFAAKAMQAELASSSFGKAAEALAHAAVRHNQTVGQRIASNAYGLADAMLAERAKGGQS